MKLHRIIQYILSSLLLLICVSVTAANTAPNTAVMQVTDQYNFGEELNMLQSYEQRLDQSQLSDRGFEDSIARLKQLNSEYTVCLKNAQTQVDAIQANNKKYNNFLSEGNDLIAEYFNKNYSIYKNEVRECYFLMTFSYELLQKYGVAYDHSRYSVKLSRKEPLWVGASFHGKAGGGFKETVFWHATGLQGLTIVQGIFIAVVVLFAFFVFQLIQRYIKALLKHKAKKKRPLFVTVLLQSIQSYGLLMIIFGFLTLYWKVIFQVSHPFAYMTALCFALFLFFSYLFLLKFIFGYFYHDYQQKVTQQSGRKIQRSLMWLGVLFLVGYVLYVIFSNQKVALGYVFLSKTVFNIVFALLLYSMLYHFCKLSSRIRENKMLCSAINVCLMAGVLIITILSVIGYYSLSMYILWAVFLSVVCSIILYILCFITWHLLSVLQNTQHPIVAAFHKKLGISDNQPIKEINLLRYCIAFFIVYGFLIYMFEIWHADTNFINSFQAFMRQGVAAGKFQIQLFNIVLAFVIYSILMIIGRFLAQTMSHRTRGGGAAGVELRSTRYSIYYYIFLFISVAVALIASGINFTGILVVLGGLSVGIGMGLRGIISNFVSGLILLVERTVKVGDYVEAGSSAGTVKKIHLRFTQLVSPDNTDIIVPNETMISRDFINYSYNNNIYRVKCDVGVAYDSDVNLVLKLLREIAESVPGLLLSDKYPILTRLDTMGNSTINFYVTAYIKDAGDRGAVKDYMNREILAKFAAHDIDIAFDQLVVHFDKAPPTPINT